ncbi:MAG: hypothetical protein ACK4RK_13230 [Gemmataceae bacterium]
MVRTILVVGVLLVGDYSWAAPPATSSSSERKVAGMEVKKPVASSLKLATPQGPKEFVVTEQTEVKLNGQSCAFAAVPDNAVITLLEVSAEDDQTVLRIFFRSRK